MRRALGFATLALALAVGAGAAGGTSAWSPAVALSERPPPCVPAKCTTFPELAMNARGDAAAVWRRYYGFEMSRPLGFDCSLAIRPAGGAWSKPETVPGGACPAVAVDGRGRTIAVWTAAQDGRQVVLAQVRSVSGLWLRGQRISLPKANAMSPRVAVTGTGAAVAVWLSASGGRYAVVAAVAAPGDRFGAARTVSAAGASASTSLRLAVNGRGDAAVAWSAIDRGRNVARVAVRPLGGSWEPVQTLAESSGLLGTPAVGLGPDGDAIAIWSEYVRAEATTILRTSGRPARGRFGSATVLARGGAGPQVGLDSRGNAVATWVQTAGGVESAFAAFRPRGGAWQPSRVISAPGVPVSSLVSAVAPGGGVIAVWRRLRFDGSSRMDAVQAAVQPAGGRFGAPRDLSREGLVGGFPTVAIDARGNGVALWEGIDGVVEAARYS